MVTATILFGSHLLLRRLFLFIGSTTLLFLTHEYIKPRLPIYTIELKIYPFVHFVKSSVTHQWQTILSTNIQFYNENYLHLSIHAMTFDAYIERYDEVDDNKSSKSVTTNPTKTSSAASLLHIATITDQNQHQIRSGRNGVSSSDAASNEFKDILWSIPGRTNFTIQHCPLYMSFFDATTTVTTMTYVRSILLVVYKLTSYTIHKIWQNGAVTTTFTIPTTGVAHIRASILPNNKNNTTVAAAAVPFTVGMICNNEISIFHMQIIGVQCQQYMMIPGWTEPIATAAQKLRNFAVMQLRIQNTTTGSVIG